MGGNIRLAVLYRWVCTNGDHIRCRHSPLYQDDSSGRMYRKESGTSDRLSYHINDLAFYCQLLVSWKIDVEYSDGDGLRGFEYDLIFRSNQ